LIPILLVWLLVAVLIGFVSLASMAAAAALPAYLAFSGTEPRLPLLTFGVISTLLILFTHRANIARMRSGTEPRARRLWLLGRRGA
jgi:glycerol-3-phosphate acyltransferase PlsY